MNVPPDNSIHRAAGRGQVWLLLGLFVVGVVVSVAVLTMRQAPAPVSASEPPAGVPPAADRPGGSSAASLDSPGAETQRLAASSADARSDSTPEEPPLEGIHVFPPAGTKPNLTGVVVPEDFELPPGYLRHYQTTDDGRRLPPILMYDPDRPPLDENGQPVEVTSDLVVPADRVPAGMRVEVLEMPKPVPPPSSVEELLRRQ